MGYAPCTSLEDPTLKSLWYSLTVGYMDHLLLKLDPPEHEVVHALDRITRALCASLSLSQPASPPRSCQMYGTSISMRGIARSYEKIWQNPYFSRTTNIRVSLILPYFHRLPWFLCCTFLDSFEEPKSFLDGAVGQNVGLAPTRAPQPPPPPKRRPRGRNNLFILSSNASVSILLTSTLVILVEFYTCWRPVVIAMPSVVRGVRLVLACGRMTWPAAVYDLHIIFIVIFMLSRSHCQCPDHYSLTRR